MSRSRVARVVWIGVVLSAFVACKDKKQSTTPTQGGDATAKIDASLCEGDGKRVETYDLNKDGKDDVWRLYASANGAEYMTCKQIDFDHDGRKDWLVASGPDGTTLYQKADFDYDGKFDMTAVFEGNRIAEVERDTDFDGKFDVKEVYDASNQLTAVRRDRNADNKPDQWETYVNGQLTTVAFDDDFDGKVDRREDGNGAAAPPPPTLPADPQPASPPAQP